MADGGHPTTQLSSRTDERSGRRGHRDAALPLRARPDGHAVKRVTSEGSGGFRVVTENVSAKRPTGKS